MIRGRRHLRKSNICSASYKRRVDAYVDQLDSVLSELLDKYAPVRTSRRRPSKISRWLSDEACVGVSNDSGAPPARTLIVSSI